MKAPAPTLTASGKVRKKPGRVPVSCAECRRLKMKCDRGVPCENCSKRGCASICPDGTLTTGKHNRLILSNTEELHDRIEFLLDRVKLLEDALRTLQASVSTQPHPLLSDSHYSRLHAVSPVPSVSTAVQSKDMLNVTDDSTGGSSDIDSHGTLLIGPHEEMRFLGPTARSDYLLIHDIVVDTPLRRLPRHFYSYSWPEAPDPDPDVATRLESFLPDLPEAQSLCGIYSNIAQWLGFLLPTSVIYDEFLAHVYHLPNYPWHDVPYTCPTILALLFSIFALAALFDPAKPLGNADSADYFQLAKVALSCTAKLQNATVYTIFTLINMSTWLFHKGEPMNQESSYRVSGVACRLSSSMGLHLDSSRWNISVDLARKRHAAFWQLYVLEANIDIHFGRQSFFTDAVIEAPLPDNVVELNPRHHYHTWFIGFVRFKRSISRVSSRSHQLSYSNVLDLHVKIRSYAEPDWQQMWSMLDNPDDPMQKVFMRVKKASAGLFRNTLLLNLHRGFLIQALQESPQDPFASKYATSIRECYEASREISTYLIAIAEVAPRDASTSSFWFAMALASCIIKVLIATRCSSAEFAPSAIQELDDLYHTIRHLSIREKTCFWIMEVVSRLRDAAHGVLAMSQNLSYGGPPSSVSSELSNEDISMMERCCGKTQTWIGRRKWSTPVSEVTSGFSLPNPVPRHSMTSATSHPVPSLPQLNDKGSSMGDPGAKYQHDSVDKAGSVPSARTTFLYSSMNGEAGTAADSGDPQYAPSSTGWFLGTSCQSLDPSWTPFIQQLGF